MPDQILKPNVTKANYDSSEDENQALLSEAPTLEVNAEVHAAGEANIQSSKIRDDSQHYESQTSSNDAFETAASSSAENVHSDDMSSVSTVYKTIEIDKNYDDSTTTTEERKSARSSFEFENMDEQYHVEHNSVIQSFRNGIRDAYNFILSKVRGDSEMQGTHDSATGNFMATEEVLAENIESDDLLSMPSTSYVSERAGVKMSNYSPPKSGDGKSTGSYISSTTTFSSSTTFKSTEMNEIMGIQEPESLSDNERIATPISKRESPCREQQTQVSQNRSRRPRRRNIIFSQYRDPSHIIMHMFTASFLVLLALTIIVPTVMHYLDFSLKDCIVAAAILLFFCIVFSFPLLGQCRPAKVKERAAKSPHKARYDRLLDRVEIIDLPKVMALST